MNKNEIIIWSAKFATGVQYIDLQHKELLDLTNELYKACLVGNKETEDEFKEVMGRMVKYVRFHFSDELKILGHIKYPQLSDHKKEHNNLINDILQAAKDFDEGKQYVPMNFVRTLKDWVFGHIAVTDRLYANFISEQKKNGLLSDNDIETFASNA